MQNRTAAALKRLKAKLKPQIIFDKHVTVLDEQGHAELNLENLQIEDSDIPRICEYVRSHPHIISLNLGGNKITDNSLDDINSLANIRNLNVSRNGLTALGTNLLASNHQYTSLDLSGTEVNLDVIQLLSDHPTLESLRIAECFLGASAAVLLANNFRLRHLDMSWNNIGSEGATALASILSLKTLILRHNNIDNEGMNVLLQNSNLTTLDVEGNNITQITPHPIPNTSLLTELNLSKNMISDTAKYFAVDNKLESLDVSHCDCTDVTAKALIGALNLTLIAKGNAFSQEGIDTLNIKNPIERVNCSRREGLAVPVPSLWHLTNYQIKVQNETRAAEKPNPLNKNHRHS